MIPLITHIRLIGDTQCCSRTKHVCNREGSHIQTPRHGDCIAIRIRLISQCKRDGTCGMESPVKTCPMEEKGSVGKFPSVVTADRRPTGGRKCLKSILAYYIIIS